MTEEQRSRSRQGENAGGSPLQSDKGTTNIQDSVVQKIAGVAAQEVEGVRMGSGTSHTVGNILGSIPGVSGGGSQSSGVSVEVGTEEAALDLTCTVAYGSSIPRLADAVRNNVVSRVENLVGLRVTEVNITVSDVFFPEQERGEERQRQIEQQREEARAQEQRVH